MNNYDGSAIEILKDLEGIRRRPNMYIGNTTEEGLLQCLTEAFVNSIDEVANKYGDLIEVELLDPIGFRVTDNGRGIPIENYKDTEIPTVTLLFTKIHSGGKLTAQSNYKSSIGQMGVGCKILNALSKECIVEVCRNSKLYRQTFSKGNTTSDLTYVNEPAFHNNGTRITWIPDSTIFKDIIEYSYGKTKKLIQTHAYLNPGVRFKFSDKRNKKTEEIISHNGIADMMSDYLGEDKPIFTPVHFKSDTGNQEFEVIYTYTNDNYESLHSYVNGLHMIEGGSHVQGFRSGFTKALNDIARQQGFLKEKDANISGMELKDGLTAIVNIRIPDPVFENQTKTKLTNPEIVQPIQELVYYNIVLWASKKPKEAKQLVDRVLLTRKIREASKKARELIMGTKAAKKNNLTLTDSKLAHCVSRKPEECELYIIEGDSAAGTVRMARDSKTQAIFPLRGKVLNVEKKTELDVFKNKELKELIISLGCGIKEDYDEKKLRYHKIIIATDADASL